MKPKITKQVDGKHVEVDIDNYWETICRVICLARIMTTPSVDGDKYLIERLAHLSERLEDLKGISFHGGRGAL